MAISTSNLIPDCPRAQPSTRDIEPNAIRSPWLWSAVRRWIDTSAGDKCDEAHGDRIDWLRAAPFVAMHVACLGVLWVGVSGCALSVAAALYAVRMFALTGFSLPSRLKKTIRFGTRRWSILESSRELAPS